MSQLLQSIVATPQILDVHQLLLKIPLDADTTLSLAFATSYKLIIIVQTITSDKLFFFIAHSITFLAKAFFHANKNFHPSFDISPVFFSQ